MSLPQKNSIVSLEGWGKKIRGCSQKYVCDMHYANMNTLFLAKVLINKVENAATWIGTFFKVERY